MTSNLNGDQPTDSGKSYQDWIDVLFGLGVVFLCTLVAFLFDQIGVYFHHHVHSSNIVMVYLLGVVFVALRGSGVAALACALFTVISFDFFFVEPLFSLLPSDRQFLIVVTVMFVVALVVNEMAQTARENAELAEEAKVEAESEKTKNTLLRSVSHDLKSPLVSIMGSASLLGSEQALSEEQRRELAQSIATEADRLNNVLSNLLNMTRVEVEGTTIETQWHIIDEIIGSAISVVEPRLGNGDIEIVMNEKTPLVKVDALLMEQVLVNLLDNCIKYAPDTKYTISVRANPDELTISVCNQGEPLGQEERQKVFDKFYRASSSTHGAGLGLAICKSIIELHGGKIWVDPQVTNGVSICLTLPVSAEAKRVEHQVEEETGAFEAIEAKKDRAAKPPEAEKPDGNNAESGEESPAE